MNNLNSHSTQELLLERWDAPTLLPNRLARFDGLMFFGSLTFQEYLEKQKVKASQPTFSPKKTQTKNIKYSACHLHNKDSNSYCIQVVVRNFMFKDKRLNDLPF